MAVFFLPVAVSVFFCGGGCPHCFLAFTAAHDTAVLHIFQEDDKEGRQAFPRYTDQGKQDKGQGSQAQHDDPCGQTKGQEQKHRQPGHGGQDAGLDHVPCPEHAAEKRACIHKVRRDDIGIVVILIVHMVVPLFRSVSVPAMVKSERDICKQGSWPGCGRAFSR